MSTTCDLYLRLSDARREEALDGRQGEAEGRKNGSGWTVARVIIENDSDAWQRQRERGAAPGVGVQAAQDHHPVRPDRAADGAARVPLDAR